MNRSAAPNGNPARFEIIGTDSTKLNFTTNAYNEYIPKINIFSRRAKSPKLSFRVVPKDFKENLKT